MPTVTLLLSNERDRSLIRDHLHGDHEVRLRETVAPDDVGDLWVLDGPALERNHGDLRATKADLEPVFLPVLLVASRRAPEQFPADVWEAVDEVIEAPVDPAELDARVRSLLRQRRQSLELQRQRDHSEARLRSLFEAAPDPMVVVRPDGTVTEANDAFGDLFDVAPAEAEGRRLGEFAGEARVAAERVVLAVEDSPEGGRTEAVEWPVDADPTPLVTELHVDAVSGLAGVTERIGVFRDVSERIRRERQLRRQNERLEEFASTLAHDLRNPLSIAQGALTEAREGGDEHAFDDVEQGLDRMEELIEELLALAREGKLVVDPEPVGLRDAAEQAWTTVATADATLETTDDLVVLADENRLVELFENLFRNAVEHGSTSPRHAEDAVEHGSRRPPLQAREDAVEQGSTSSRPEADDAVEHAEPDVSVTVGPLDREDGAAGFFVADDGPGIPLSDADVVFEAGYTTTEDGTGMGLRIVREIAVGHGWDVTLAESASGGARFEFTGVELAD